MDATRLEEINKEIAALPNNCAKWADLILESSAIVNGTTSEEMYQNITKELKRDLGAWSQDGSYIKGYIDGMEMSAAYTRANYPVNLQFIHSYTITRAVLIKHLETLKA